MSFLWILLPALALLSLLAFFLRYRGKAKKQQAEQEISAGWAKPKEGQYFNFHLIGRYFKNRTRLGAGYFQIISHQISEDLYLDEVFKYIDRTTSRIGQQYLYYKLRAVDSDIEKLKRFDRLVKAFLQHDAQRTQCQLLLKPLEKGDSYYFEEMLHGEPVQAPKWLPLVYVLSFAVLALAVLAFAFPGLLLFLLPLFIVNLLVHYWNKENINYYLIALSEFDKAYTAAGKLQEQTIVKEHGASSDFLQALTPLKKKMRWVNFSSQFESDSTSIFYALFELLKIAFNLEILFFFSLTRSIKAKAAPLNELFVFIGQLDAAISTASLRAGLPVCCTPTFCPPKQLNVSGLRHPLLKDCIPNDLRLSRKSLLLTGSNMSGKTTFIRAVGLNMLLAQTLYCCTAERFEAPFSKIHTSINITDDLLSEKSYYFEEVTTIKAFLECSQQTEPALFILDEIFKGTNTVERIAGGKAILSYLAKGNHLVLVSTHDTELTALLTEEFALHHFSESVQGTALLFDHKIKPGPLTTRNAIKILEMSHYPEEIIAEANRVIGAMERG
ncbi:MutS-related protein [Pontibacter actiniarum]|nr:hypothetical protein [Pontibacter actiniarum]